MLKSTSVMDEKNGTVEKKLEKMAGKSKEWTEAVKNNSEEKRLLEKGFLPFFKYCSITQAH